MTTHLGLLYLDRCDRIVNRVVTYSRRRPLSGTARASPPVT
ncbi:hypothetical protein POG22_15155 [Geitlerinema sp. CS-897]|nr:hypothetical protein [Geitlerinema sp. CS-897]